MTFVSMFEFRFLAQHSDEGRDLARAIGADMPALDGYVGHEVVQDVADPGHFMVNTRWASREQGEAVLGAYRSDGKVKRAEELIPGGPKGFIATVLE